MIFDVLGEEVWRSTGSGRGGFDLLRPPMSRPTLRDIEFRRGIPRERDRISEEDSSSEGKYMGMIRMANM